VREIEGISPSPPDKKCYFKPKREMLKKQLAHFIIDECLTNRQIAERCNTSVKNVERWVNEYYKEQNDQLIKATSPESAATAMNRARDRLERHKQRMLAELEDSALREYVDRADYWNVICELEIADWKFTTECPPMLARQYSLTDRDNRMLPRLLATEPDSEDDDVDEYGYSYEEPKRQKQDDFVEH
jgi:transposase